MLYRLVQFLDWIYHASALERWLGDETGWSRICDKWEELNTDG